MNYSVANEHGFRFSINNDVPQYVVLLILADVNRFQIYGNLTNRAWNNRLRELQYHTNPHIITLSTKNGTTILIFSSGPTGTVCHVMHTSKVLSSHLEVTTLHQLKEVSSAINSVNIFSLEHSHTVIIQDEHGTFYFYQYDEKTLKFLQSVQRFSDSNMRTFLQSSLVETDGKGYLAHLVSSETCNLELELLRIQFKLPKIELTLKSRHCLGNLKSTNYSIVDATIALIADDSSHLNGLVFFTASDGEQYSLFSSTIKLKATTDENFAVTAPTTSSLEDYFVWIGSAESIHASSAKFQDTHMM